MRLSPHRSKSTHELQQSIVGSSGRPNYRLNIGKWREKVASEHQEPLKQLWEWLCSNKDLTPRDLAERMLSWPIVIVTVEEEKSLNGYHNLGP
jgi:hypothetical protein